MVKIKTWVPGARDAHAHHRPTATRVENGLRYFEGDDEMQWAHDELYWNVTGDEWEMEIARAQATGQPAVGSDRRARHRLHRPARSDGAAMSNSSSRAAL